MEIFLDPSAWIGLITLVILEIVLGIDNLIFIAILSEKLPPSQRDKARMVGLALALVMRLFLLSIMSWLVTLTTPVLIYGPVSLSVKDLILLVGGFFLLFKATSELHHHIDVPTEYSTQSKSYASFWVIVTQIVVLDAVFSIDSVITAVGMVKHLPVMMAAVVIAIGVMLVASKHLTRFVNAHPSVVILCLTFLIMIGMSLIAESFHMEIPKGYLYTAIAFSVIIEAFNQVARRNTTVQQVNPRSMREKTAEGVLRMLGKQGLASDDSHASNSSGQQVFVAEERNMVSGVLSLAERSVSSIMTPRTEVSWIDIHATPSEIKEILDHIPHSFFPVCNGNLDDVIGIMRAKDLMMDYLEGRSIDQDKLRQPLVVPETIGILNLLDTLKLSKGQLALVSDEFGSVVGVVTPIDIFEIIAGEFPDEDEQPDIQLLNENHWIIDGAADVQHVEQTIHTDELSSDDEEYSTFAGYLLVRFGQLPNEGDFCELYDEHRQSKYIFTVLKVEERRIAEVDIQRIVIASDED